MKHTTLPVRWEKLGQWVRRAALYLLPPFTAFYLMQFAYGAYPREMSLGVVLANSLCLGALYFLLCAVTGYPAACCVVLHLLGVVWGSLNYFVSLYRGTPVLPWDLTALETAVAVSGSYSYIPTPQMLAALAVVALLAWLLRRQLGQGGFFPSWKHGKARLLCLAAGGVCAVLVALPGSLARLGVQTDVWDQGGSYRTSGTVAAFLRNLEFLQVEEPDDLSPQHLSAIMDQVEPQDSLEVGVEHPNIIAIMNESWADFEEFGNLTLTESVTDSIQSVEGLFWGHAYTSVFGAGTSASEFEFLTGNSMAFLPSGSIPYQQYILEDSPSLAALLRSSGYRTLALHPGEYTSWQRNQAYPRLGFEQFKCGEDMDVEQTYAHGYVSDASDFEQIIWEFENKAAGEPLFLFNVTIQNHGSYTDGSYPAQVQLADRPGEFPMAEQYLTLANETDEAFLKLVEYFSQQEEPTIILMFGDHQPSVEQEFLDLAYGVSQADMTMEQYMGKYRVPYVLWANYPVEFDAPESTSLNFLGQYLLRYAGIESDPYGAFLWDLQTVIPALTFVGYTDAQGNAYSHLETNEYTPLIEDYQCLQYMRLFGDRPGETIWAG